jgi:hypothetical protein
LFGVYEKHDVGSEGNDMCTPLSPIISSMKDTFFPTPSSMYQTPKAKAKSPNE